MKYKVGDKVRIKSLDWYNEHQEGGNVKCKTNTFIKSMSKYCGKEATIIYVNGLAYAIDLDGSVCFWTDDMFEGLVVEDSDFVHIENPEILVEDSYNTTDWEQRRFELVKALMSGGLDSLYKISDKPAEIINECIIVADEAIKQLRKRE